MPRRATLLLLGLAACTPLRPLDPVDSGPATLDAARPDAAGDAPGLDAYAPDAPGPGADAPGPDAFVESPDASAPVDAFVPIDGNCLPMGAEVCGGGDEDCDGMTDEADAVGARTWYPDFDRDNYGADAGAVTACVRPPDMGLSRWADRGGDCDDMDEQVRPGRIEQCNAVDDDCNGLLDDGDPCPATNHCWTHTYGGHTYQFCDGRMTWNEAAAQCATWGYHLVWIETAAENDWVTATADARGLHEGTGLGESLCSIGLRLDEASMTFRWQDGTPATYTAWDVGEPDGYGSCVRIRNRSGVWSDSRCLDPFDFVCETP